MDLFNAPKNQGQNELDDDYLDDEFDLENSDDLKKLIGESPEKKGRAPAAGKFNSNQGANNQDSAKLDDIDDLVEEELRKNDILEDPTPEVRREKIARTKTGPSGAAAKPQADLSADGGSLDLSPKSRGSNEHASGESQQMFKELFQTGNSSFGKDKSLPGIGNVQVSVSSKSGSSGSAEAQSKAEVHSGKSKSKFQSSGVAFDTAADLDGIEDEITAENKENVQRYKVS